MHITKPLDYSTANRQRYSLVVNKRIYQILSMLFMSILLEFKIDIYIN